MSKFLLILRTTAKMPRSPRSPGSSNPPLQGGKRSRSSSPPRGGGKKAHISCPKKSCTAIRFFFLGRIDFIMLLQFLIGTNSLFNWNAYQGNQMLLGPLTVEIVAKWLLTIVFRKPAPGDQEISDQQWHHVLQFLRENAQQDDLKLLFDFIKKHQKDLRERCIIPHWVQICLAPLCGSDAVSMSNLISLSFAPPPQFWQNALQGVSPAFLHFWFTEQTSYVWQHLLFQLLQQPLSEEIKRIVQAFFANKPFEFFMKIPVDLLILLGHTKILQDSKVWGYICSPKRRTSGIVSRFFLDETVSNQVVIEFLKKRFHGIFKYISQRYQNDAQTQFSRVFIAPHAFFSTLLETPNRLVQSNILGQEIVNFLHLFCWNTNIFFPRSTNLGGFVSKIMSLPDCWKFLFVQLWRCEPSMFPDFHISHLIKFVREQHRCLFSKTLASMMKVYMEQVVANATSDIRKCFFKWLLEQKQAIQAHFPLTRDDVQFCLHEFPVVQTKKTLFWWLFAVHAAKIDRRSYRELIIVMTVVCEEFGLQVTEEELGLRDQGGLDPCVFVVQCLNVLTLKFKFGGLEIARNFAFACHCDEFPIDGSNVFRVFVNKIRKSLGKYMSPNPIPDCSDFLSLVTYCEAHPEFFKDMPENDRAFLNKLLESYLSKVITTEQLVQLLYRFAKLMPEDVRQAMFASCMQIKLLHNETLGSKRSCDPTDALSYEAQCSRCALYFPLQGLGMDGRLGAICRKCSQSNGIISCKPLILPFASL
jgi:hypothetical protein